MHTANTSGPYDTGVGLRTELSSYVARGMVEVNLYLWASREKEHNHCIHQ